MNEAERPWSPLSVSDVSALFAAATFPWWIAGGYAIEAAIGRSVRTHDDIDVLVLHRDLPDVRAFLADWECWAADRRGGLYLWPGGERLPETVHDIWCRRDRDHDWQFQLMADNAAGEAWQSRRDAQLTRPIPTIGWRDEAGNPILCPEIQLYYKAKNPRPKDAIDFEMVRPYLDRDAIRWLRQAITTTYGPSHSWLATMVEE